MAFKTIVTVVTNPEADRTALMAARDFAAREDGHVDVLCLGVDQTQPGVYFSGTSAVALQASLAEAERRAKEIESDVRGMMDDYNGRWATNAISAQIGSLPHVLAHHARLADIAILPKPYGEGLGHEHEAVIEASLFDAQIPVLVVPPGVRLELPWKTVMVAWNESREALNGVRAALPILQRAERVDITIIDPPVHAPDRSDPGGALSMMLSRHGVHAEVSILSKTLPRVSEVIARHLDDISADLLVMGAYGHSRFRESILGGATRNTLQMTTRPVLMAH